MLPQISQTDCNRIFQDWGRAATLDEVQRRYDPGTGMLTETSYAAPITVVLAGIQMREHAAPAAAAPLEERSFLVCESQLPSAVSLTSATVTFEEKTYAIQQVHPASLAGVLLLECATAGVRP